MATLDLRSVSVKWHILICSVIAVILLALSLAVTRGGHHDEHGEEAAEGHAALVLVEDVARV